MPDSNAPNHSPTESLSPEAYRAPASLYLHIPFCRAKCSYCDFYSYPLSGEWYTPYVEALSAEIAALGERWQRPELATVYVGGGTPTVLPPDLLDALLEATSQAFRLAPAAEITVEANPGTVTGESLARLRRAGANRLSFGVQSFQPELLRLLGRIHSAEEAVEAVSLARLSFAPPCGRAGGSPLPTGHTRAAEIAPPAWRAGGSPLPFANLNLDLIYGLPEQTLEQWQADLSAALALAPEHLSLYALTLEPDTPLTARVTCGEVPAPEADLAADMYQFAEQRLAAAGYDHYEISNWSRTPALRSRHNLTYWQNRPYAGCGAAAHSWLNGQRRANVRTPREYIDRIRAGQDPSSEVEAISPPLEKAETMILGLRLVEGVSRAGFTARFGVDPAQLYAAAIAESQAEGLLEMSPTHIRLTGRGRLLGNQVFWRFLP